MITPPAYIPCQIHIGITVWLIIVTHRGLGPSVDTKGNGLRHNNKLTSDWVPPLITEWKGPISPYGRLRPEALPFMEGEMVASFCICCVYSALDCTGPPAYPVARP